ncbi:inositol-pentakisphosphate 2-kinase isoform X3 [Drosophila santomea]|uniref:inositol-pentakisphosphate 2-kinase isoform X3 n=1 Tax=Drosophila santomea TaxID=129105 RepID=UPI001954962D|nr:inositol-pentakisphosphate 2-kinase isoform X3 [Drosophila santomea]
MTAAGGGHCYPGMEMGMGMGLGQKLKLRAQPQPQPQWMAKNLHALLDLPAAMELRQIELIYRAEGNANLVLALPQFKKVLRLPKMISSRLRQAAHQRHEPADEVARPEGQRVATEKAGDLTMPDFMAYIGIMRRLLGNEFVCGADIVAIPKEGDRFWINEHIRDQRPVSRLDKEFVGPFGLLLPDVTQLPATFDVLLANLQAKGTTGDEAGVGRTRNRSAVRRLGDTYAIEIKPKQGWLQLASDVNDLFDLMPSGAVTKPKETPHNQAENEPLARDKCGCRFCSMQLLKLHNGKIKRLGHYCPLELFSGEIMVLIKHLLVACLLREYEDPESNRAESSNQSQKQQQQQQQPELELEQLNQSRVSIAATETKEGAAGIGAANVVLPLGGRAAAPVVTAGQFSTRTRAAAATATTQRYTKVARMETTITKPAATSVAGAATSSQLSGNVLAMATAVAVAVASAAGTETKTEPETRAEAEAEAASTTSRNVNQNESQKLNRNEPANQTQAQDSKAEIFRLPKNCVLQKILNLQLLVKRHFDFMWQSGYSDHSRPTYNSLRGLLAAVEGGEEEAELEPDEEQAYMVGATALDCSIMLTFQEIEIKCETDCRPADQSSYAALQPWCVSLLGHHFLTKLCVLDLDPKPDSHFHKFIAQTREIEKCRRALN